MLEETLRGHLVQFPFSNQGQFLNYFQQLSSTRLLKVSALAHASAEPDTDVSQVCLRHTCCCYPHVSCAWLLSRGHGADDLQQSLPTSGILITHGTDHSHEYQLWQSPSICSTSVYPLDSKPLHAPILHMAPTFLLFWQHRGPCSLNDCQVSL